MNNKAPIPHAIALTGRELLMAENHRLKAKAESQRTQLNELRRKLTESEERNAHSNAMLRRATRLLDEVVYSKQQSSELIEEVEAMRAVSRSEGTGFTSRCLIVKPTDNSDGGDL